MGMVEGMVARVFKEMFKIDIAMPIKRISYDEAMNTYGSDKPDLRISLTIEDISDIYEKTVPFT
ncbi:amino acid--tRNA ligase-related protein [Candidatus Omnitrophota bacterium]